MKAWEVVGYAFDGDCYHVECLKPLPCDCEKDGNGFCEDNCHGYGPNPIFAGDEDIEDYSCGACHEKFWD